MNPLYTYLKSTLGFADKEIEQAFETIDRADFVLPEYARLAYQDQPLPIGYAVTISQPTTVAFMLNQLNPKIGDKILDVGSGSGWTTALLAHIVGQEGKVIGIEIIPELVEFGNTNLNNYIYNYIYNYKLANAKIILADKDRVGYEKEAPYDRILVSAAADELPKELVNQLKVGGTMVIPIQNSVWKITKVSQDKIDQKEFPGFIFVPLK